MSQTLQKRLQTRFKKSKNLQRLLSLNLWGDKTLALTIVQVYFA